MSDTILIEIEENLDVVEVQVIEEERVEINVEETIEEITIDALFSELKIEIVQDMEELAAIPEHKRYLGMAVYVLNENSFYRYSNENGPEEWMEILPDGLLIEYISIRDYVLSIGSEIFLKADQYEFPENNNGATGTHVTLQKKSGVLVYTTTISPGSIAVLTHNSVSHTFGGNFAVIENYTGGTPIIVKQPSGVFPYQYHVLNIHPSDPITVISLRYIILS